MRTAKEFWNEAKEELGFAPNRGYDETTLTRHPLAHLGEYKLSGSKSLAEAEFDLWQEGYGDAPMEVRFDVGLGDLSHQIRLETGQAKEMSRVEIEKLDPEQARYERAVNGGLSNREGAELYDFEQEYDTNTREGDSMQTLDNTVQRAALSEKDLRLQQMESWIIEAISKPAMPRELRLEGLEMVQDISPTARQAVERICPSMSRSQGRELQIER
jgi:hypothetical protein